MHRAAVSVFIIGLLVVGVTSCGDHEAEPSPTTFDFTPTASLSVAGTGLACTVEGSGDACEIVSGTVVSVENVDDVEHRLLGTSAGGGSVFDTGTMQPDDETTLVLTADGVVTVTDLLWPDGETPTLDVTVTPLADD